MKKGIQVGRVKFPRELADLYKIGLEPTADEAEDRIYDAARAIEIEVEEETSDGTGPGTHIEFQDEFTAHVGAVPADQWNTSFYFEVQGWPFMATLVKIVKGIATFKVERS